MLLFYVISDTGVAKFEEFAYVQCMEVIYTIFGVNRALACVCMRWAMAGEVNITL